LTSKPKNVVLLLLLQLCQNITTWQ